MDSYVITGKLHDDEWFCSIFKHEKLMNSTRPGLAFHDNRLYPELKGSDDFRSRSSVLAGWQKQGHTWHIVPRNYSTKVGLIDLIMEKNWGKEEKSRRKMKKSEG